MRLTRVVRKYTAFNKEFVVTVSSLSVSMFNFNFILQI